MLDGFLTSKYILPSVMHTVPQMNDTFAFKQHSIQIAYWNSKTRFNIVAAGRRSGKTHLAKKKICYAALTHAGDRGKFFVGSPTRDQSKQIYWEDLKKMLQPFLIEKPRETELLLRVYNADVRVVGMDKPSRIEGVAWNGGILDEYANMKEDVWDKHVEPALATKEGWCDFIGVPEGRNHYHSLCLYAVKEENTNWSFFTWKSADILSESVIAQAKAHLDEHTYLQEYEGNFGARFSGVYYNFSDANKALVEYDNALPLHFCFDFNVSPGVAVIFQEGILPNKLKGIRVIDEVHIKTNSNTVKVVQTLIDKYPTHTEGVVLHGDATGGAKGSAKIAGTDWDIIRYMLQKYNVDFKVPKANPPERVRVNTVNSLVKTMTGDIKLYINPKKCPMTILDLEAVSWNSNGEIDKTDQSITHLSDAIGYGLCSISNGTSRLLRLQ